MRPRHAQAMLVTVGACLAVIAYGFASAGTTRTGDGLWPAWFAIAAASCIALGVAPHSRLLFMASGVLVPMAFAAKVVGSVVDIIEKATPDPGRTVAGVGLWTLVGVLAATTWVFVLGPVVSYTAQRRR